MSGFMGGMMGGGMLIPMGGMAPPRRMPQEIEKISLPLATIEVNLATGTVLSLAIDPVAAGDADILSTTIGDILGTALRMQHEFMGKRFAEQIATSPELKKQVMAAIGVKGE